MYRPSPPLLIALSLLLGCGGAVYAPGLQAGFELEPEFEINDADIAKAFAARPQLRAQNQVAFYTFDQARLEDIEATLKGVKGVKGIYHLPPLLVEGRRTLAERHYYWARERPKFSLKKLRLLAARAHCDVLVIFDKQHRYNNTVNGWVALTPLILPVFFLPYVDVEVESSLDAYIMDVRNGYLYGHIHLDELDRSDSHTIWTATADEHIDAQWAKLNAKIKTSLEELLSKSQLQMKAPEAEKKEVSAQKTPAKEAPAKYEAFN